MAAALPELPAVIAEWDAALAEVGRTLLRHWAVSLGSPADVFDDAFADTPATLIKIVRYPAQADTPQGVGAHRDAGVLTLLLAEPGSEGLRSRVHGASERRNEAWIDVDPVPGAFIVNIGEMLEIASGGYLRATEHRVRLSSRERISVPYFFNPRLDAHAGARRCRTSWPRSPRRQRGSGQRTDLLGLRPQCMEEPAAGASRRGGRAWIRVKMELL